MSTLTITRPPQFLDPWFVEIEQVWDEIEAATNDQETRIGNLETAIVSSVVTSLSAQGEPALTGPVVLDKTDDITLTQVGNTITIGGGITDHGGLAGLLDDDHTIYLLADGTRSLTGDMSHGLTQALNFRVEGFATPPAAGNQGRLIFNQTTGRLMVDNGSAFIDSGITVHADLGGLTADDHLQYARTNGTRDITGDQTFLQDIIVTGQFQAPLNETWEAYSQEDDGASSLAFLFDTANLMDTAGSKVLAVRNATNEVFAILRDSDPSPLGTFSDEHVIKLTEKTGSDVGYIAMTTDPALVLLGADGVAVNALSTDTAGDYLGAMQLDGDGPTHAALLAQDLAGTGSPKAEVSAEDTVGGGEKAEFTASLAAGVDPLGRVRAANGAITSYADHVAQLNGINPEAWLKSTSGSETATVEGSFDGSTVPFVELEVAATAGTDKLLLKNAEFDFQINSNSELQVRAGEVEVLGTLIGGSSPFILESKETDGASAIGFTLDTQNDLADAGAKILSLQNNSIEKAYIGEDGKAWLPAVILDRQTTTPIGTSEGEGLFADTNGDLQYYGPNNNLIQITDGDILSGSFVKIVPPSAGGAGIEAAILEVISAGGGIVQLLTGTYAITSELKVDGTDALNNVTIRGIGDETILDIQTTGVNYPIALGGRLNTYDDLLNDVTKGDTSIYTTTPGDASAVLEGDLIYIVFTDDDGYIRTALLKAAGDGVALTGEIPIVDPITKNGTSARILRCTRYGNNIKLQNFKITKNASSTDAYAGIYITYLNSFIIEGVNVFDIDAGDAFDTGTGIYAINCYFGTIRDCRTRGCVESGITLYGTYDVVMERCAAIECALKTNAHRNGLRIRNFASKTTIKYSYVKNCGHRGIYLHPQSSTVCSEISLINNRIEDIDGYGIYATGCVDVEIASNVISVVEEDGIYTGDTDHIRCSNNLISDAGRSGIYNQTNGNYGTYTGNVVRNVVSTGITITSGEGNVVANNSVYDCVAYGYSLNSTQGSTLTGNFAKDCGRGAFIHNATDCIINGNVFFGCTYGIYLSDSSTYCMIANNNSRGQTLWTGAGVGNDFVNNKE